MNKTQAKARKDLIPTVSNEFKGEDTLKAMEFGIKNNKQVLLVGETGTGKTSAVKYLAHKHKKPYRRLSFESGTTSDDVIGKILLNKQGTYWIDGDLTSAVRNGEWVLLDEVNACPPEVMFKLHPLMDDDAHIILNEHDGEIVKAHPDFRLFAALNPNYAGTRMLNRAFVSRFEYVINFEHLPKDEEIALLMERTSVKKAQAEKMVDVAIRLRANNRDGILTLPMSFRELEAWADLTPDFGFDKAFALTVVNKCYADSSEREAIYDAFKLI